MRRRFLRRLGEASYILPKLTITIAPPAAAESQPWRRARAWGYRARGELPAVPMYQRTYGVG